MKSASVMSLPLSSEFFRFVFLMFYSDSIKQHARQCYGSRARRTFSSDGGRPFLYTAYLLYTLRQRFKPYDSCLLSSDLYFITLVTLLHLIILIKAKALPKVSASFSSHRIGAVSTKVEQLGEQGVVSKLLISFCGEELASQDIEKAIRSSLCEALRTQSWQWLTWNSPKLFERRAILLMPSFPVLRR